MPQHISTEEDPAFIGSRKLNFLWLELTNRCNLECVHCYADSGPNPSKKDLLSVSDYETILSDSAQLGCKQVQFIGGEPTLNKNLSRLIEHAHKLGYEFMEVFTNLVNLPQDLLQCFVDMNVHVATSAYADSAPIHDQITQRAGSFDRTMRNIDRVVEAGLPLRVGIISMPSNQDDLEKTTAFLRRKGVKEIATDTIRDFGRGNHESSSKMENLCGKCAGSVLCVGPDGVVSPCIMSKQWSIGSMLETPFAELSQSDRLAGIRQQIAEKTTVPEIHAGECSPMCHPSCSPNCVPECNPSRWRGYSPENSLLTSIV